MNFKVSKLAVSLFAALAFSSQAFAIVPVPAPISITQNYGLSTGGFVNIVNNNITTVGSGSFTDVFNLVVSSPVNLNLFGTLTAINGVGPLGLLVSTSNATLSFSGNNGTLDTNNGLNGIVSGTAFNIGSGKYTLDITSNVGSNSPISGYNFLVTAAPVPEPTEGALLFSGIGLLGFIAARRKNNT